MLSSGPALAPTDERCQVLVYRSGVWVYCHDTAWLCRLVCIKEAEEWALEAVAHTHTQRQLHAYLIYSHFGSSGFHLSCEKNHFDCHYCAVPVVRRLSRVLHCRHPLCFHFDPCNVRAHRKDCRQLALTAYFYNLCCIDNVTVDCVTSPSHRQRHWQVVVFFLSSFCRSWGPIDTLHVSTNAGVLFLLF